MTFDQETGQEVSNTTSEIKEGLTTQNTDYSEHNAAHGTDAEDFENIDGYLTASSWYRPTDILRNGTDGNLLQIQISDQYCQCGGQIRTPRSII
nr:hypothetical protein [Leuconostoc mesenteroides]